MCLNFMKLMKMNLIFKVKFLFFRSKVLANIFAREKNRLKTFNDHI